MYINLRYALELRKIAQYELAARLGVSEARISRCLRGRLEFTAEEKAQIAELLGSLGPALDPVWLFARAVPPRRAQPAPTETVALGSLV